MENLPSLPDLFDACSNGKNLIVQQYLHEGGDVNVKDDFYPNQTPLHWAARANQIEVCVTLLRHGADVEVEDQNGQRPLHWACEGLNNDTVALLLSQGAMLECQDSFGSTPLHLAGKLGSVEIAQALLDAGASLLVRNSNRATPAHVAASWGQTKLLKLFLERGASVEDRDGDEATALHWAVEGNHRACVQLLLEKGADLTQRDSLGLSALHSACRSGASQACKQLLLAGANPNAPSKDGARPLHLACLGGHVEVVSLLLEHGADYLAQDVEGRCPGQGLTEAGLDPAARSQIRDSLWSKFEADGIPFPSRSRVQCENGNAQQNGKSKASTVDAVNFEAILSLEKEMCKLKQKLTEKDLEVKHMAETENLLRRQLDSSQLQLKQISHSLGRSQTQLDESKSQVRRLSQSLSARSRTVSGSRNFQTQGGDSKAQGQRPSKTMPIRSKSSDGSSFAGLAGRLKDQSSKANTAHPQLLKTSQSQPGSPREAQKDPKQKPSLPSIKSNNTGFSESKRRGEQNAASSPSKGSKEGQNKFLPLRGSSNMSFSGEFKGSPKNLRHNSSSALGSPGQHSTGYRDDFFEISADSATK